MTLIECFTESHIDNINACLALRPEKLIFIGPADKMRKPAERYRRLLDQRGVRTKFVLSDVEGMDLTQIRSVFANHIRQEPECVIDLTGGDELVIMAAGAALAQLDNPKTVRVQRFDRAKEQAVDCIHGHCPLQLPPVELTVEELIYLNGGRLHPDAYQPPVHSRPAELDKLWSIVADDPKGWNRSIMLLNEFEGRSKSKMDIRLELDRLKGSIHKFDEKEDTVRSLLDKLQRRGIIDDSSSREVLEYSYRSPLLRYCTQKAGNALEVKTLLEGRALLENGAPYFGDCRMSVSIDWDGSLHTPAERIPDTRNEIDVVLMHGTTPLFISCKNGGIGEEELYKLHTVATRFGGPYARKMLIATDLDQKSASSNRAFAQRAWDMDILLVTDAAELSKQDWRQTLRQAMQ